MMNKKPAFRFIPELIGDITHVMELSKNPSQLYLESAISTLHAGFDVYQAVIERRNTEEKEKTKQQIQQVYDKLQEERVNNYEQEILNQINVGYEKVKCKIGEGQFWDNEVRAFVKQIEANLNRLIDILKDLENDPDNLNKNKVDELMRRALRDYNRLLKSFVEEGENNG